MFAQYFGHFLLNRNLISGSQLMEAMDTQAQTRPKLGVLAINEGWMTGGQVEEVHQEQTFRDKRFGELAVELGYLSGEQVEQLLSAQQNEHLVLGQVLIDRGLISYETFSEILQEFKQEYSLTDEQFTSILQGSVEELVAAVLQKNGAPVGAWLSDYVTLFAKNLVRFVDTGIRLEWNTDGSSAAFDHVFSQEITGQNQVVMGYTAVAGSAASLVRLASLFAQEEIEGPDELMESSVGELLNLHNGIFLVNMSNRGIELDMKPQQHTSEIPEDFRGRLGMIHIYGTGFECSLLLSDLSPLLWQK